MVQALRNAISHWAVPGLAIALACGVSFAPQHLEELLRYERGLILGGDYWRILSGHFVHANLNHLLVNCLALLLCWTLFTNRQPQHYVLIGLVTLSAMTGLSLLVFAHRLDEFQGLSGLIHALLAMGATMEISERSSRWRGLFLLVLLSVKVYSEWFGTTGAVVERWTGVPVIFETHFWGVASGIAVGITVAIGIRLGQLFTSGTGALRR
ncbi:Rhomboid family protein [Microbulbifer aggregans]|uniref:Rhomboid family protein n=1 Tax=Microbulbifer aggregans TaxID=1769779 RepID=A0A1C9WC09_9GAMM|nr:rhombosortase [Microbulbifer aggregans]AOS98684.1 Rhomboid family protein [Microbulbifer aggregans]